MDLYLKGAPQPHPHPHPPPPEYNIRLLNSVNKHVNMDSRTNHAKWIILKQGDSDRVIQLRQVNYLKQSDSIGRARGINYRKWTIFKNVILKELFNSPACSKWINLPNKLFSTEWFSNRMV